MAANQITTQSAVVITGASTGIGEACALHLDKLGFQVFAGVRKAMDGEALKREASHQLTPILIDVTDSTSIKSAVEIVTKAVGEVGLAGLINNAGIAVTGPLEFLPMVDLREQFEVNVIGQIAVIQAFLPLLRKKPGRIVNLGSMSGKLALPYLGPYAASKFALEALTDSLRVELRPWGIRVSMIEPGNIATPIWEKSKAATEARMKRLPPQAQDLYGSAIATMLKAADKMSKAAISPDKVVQAVVHALRAKRPKIRYRVRQNAKIIPTAIHWFPDSLRDWIIMKRFSCRGRSL